MHHAVNETQVADMLLFAYCKLRSSIDHQFEGEKITGETKNQCRFVVERRHALRIPYRFKLHIQYKCKCKINKIGATSHCEFSEKVTIIYGVNVPYLKTS